MASSKFRSLRKRYNLSQKIFGESVGVSRSVVSKWETIDGKFPDTATLVLICNKYKVSADYLLNINKMDELSVSIEDLDQESINILSALAVKLRRMK